MTVTQTPARRRSRSFGTGLSKLALLLLFCAIVLVPLIRMLTHITPDSISKVFSSPTIGRVTLNTVTVSLTATVITVIIAYLLALSVERTAIRAKGLFRVILVLPMLIPSISHGMGLILLLGNNGIITRLLNLKMSIYGFGGITIGSVLYAFPVAFLMFADVMKYEECSGYPNGAR